MKLHKIDKLQPSRRKLYLLIRYGIKHNCLHLMPEIQELYYTLKKQEEITQEDWNRMITGTYLEVVKNEAI